jgi:PAS domain S-box-containing protein
MKVPGYLNRIPAIYIIIYLVISLLIIGLITDYLIMDYYTVKEEKIKELKNISTVKANEISTFINEQEYKLWELVNAEFFNEKIAALFQNKLKSDDIFKFLNQVKLIKSLEDIIFINPEGKILFSFHILPYDIDSLTLKVFSDRDSPKVFIDLFKEKTTGILYAYQYPVYAILNSNKKLLGFIRFQYDAMNTIIPRIEYLEPQSTREILLVKKEDNYIIYLSFLRKVRIQPFSLTENIENNQCWINLPENENLCIYDGLDYAGVPVIAVLQKIPKTNLLLITKENKAEIFQGFRSRSFIIIITLILSLLSFGGFFLFIIYRINKKRAQEELERELEREQQRQALQKEFEIVFSQINDVIFILNSKGEIVKANKAVKKLYGYEPEELIGKTIDCVCVVDEMNELFERFKKIEESEFYIYESKHRKKDGSLFDVEVNAKAYYIGKLKFLVGSVRDITERKKSLIELQRKLENEKLLTELASEMIHLNNQNFDDELEKIIRNLGTHLKVDRIRIFLKDQVTGFYNCVFEWCRMGLESYRDRLQFLNLSEEFPFLYNIISTGKLFKCKDIQLLPTEAGKEKTELTKQGIKSILWEPLYFKGELKGFLSFSCVDQLKEWTNEDDTLINIFSEILLNALQRIEFEKEILESEQKFRKLVENSSDVTLIVTKDFKNKYVSYATVNVLGYSVDERVGQNPLEIIHPDDLELVKQTLDSLKKIGDKKTIQFRAKHKLGHWIWIEATITNLIDDPVINGYVVNYHDITPTLEAYQKLQESEERYRILAEESGDVLYKLNYSTMKYEYISPVIVNLTGYTPEEINKIGFSQIIEEIYLILNPEKSKDELIVDRVKGVTGEYLADYLLRTKKGELKWVRDHSFPFYDKDGKLAGSIGILTDITEIKKKEEEILKREKFLEALVQIQKSLIFLNDLKGFYNYLVEKLGKLSDVSRCYVFENSLSEDGKLLMSQVAEWCAEGITPQIDNPELQNLPYDALGFDFMSEFKEKGYWAAIVREVPEPTKSILSAQDIKSILLIPIVIQDDFYGYIGFDDCEKEREWSQMEIDFLSSASASIALAIESLKQKQEIIRARDEALEANRLRSGFLSIISHEIRTPLNSILGYTEVLKDLFYDPANPDLQKYFETIERGGKRLLNTINQLIEMSKLEAGLLKTNIQNLDLKKYIKDTVDMLKVLADEKNLELVVDLPESNLIVEADDYCLHGILENLISNAIKYSNQGKILIKASDKKDFIEMMVKDEGIGIAEEYLKHLFKPFSQEDVSYKRKFEGTGLGLAITKGYVELIGGEIKVESKKGVGSTFTVKFRKAKVD